MALIRWQPREAFAVNREIDNLVNQFWGDAANRNGSAWHPNVDVAQNENEFVLHAELPGMNREDIQVSLEDGVLTLAGERKFETESNDKSYFHRERAYGQFKRSFQLGKDVQADKISATYKDGVLVVTLPKAEEVKPRQIEITVS